MKEKKTLSSKEKLLIIAKLIANTCSHDEIDVLCVGLLDANMRCKNLKTQSKGEYQ